MTPLLLWHSADILKTIPLGSRTGMLQVDHVCLLKVLLQPHSSSPSQARHSEDGKEDCSHKSYETESQQTLGQLKLGTWKCDTSPHGAGTFPAESAKSSELARNLPHQHVQNQTRK